MPTQQVKRQSPRRRGVGNVTVTFLARVIGQAFAAVIVFNLLFHGRSSTDFAAAHSSTLRGTVSATAAASAKADYSAERGFCELCMHTIHQVQYGSLPSCAQSAKSFGSCSQVVQVILGQASSVLQLIEEGCYQYDSYKDWQTIKPCPSHAICGRLHNNFDVDKATLCPKDFHYRFPTALGQVRPACYRQLVYTYDDALPLFSRICSPT